MSESLEEEQIIQEYTEGLTLESFIDVMVTANTIKEAYKKLFPDASSNQTCEEMWKNIKGLMERENK